jgi:quinol monooxygenase YgiN
MVIVAGHITVEPQQRESYLTGWVSIAEQARRAAGCLDFAISADLRQARSAWRDDNAGLEAVARPHNAEQAIPPARHSAGRSPGRAGWQVPRS